MREFRTSGSVRAWGEKSPRATRLQMPPLVQLGEHEKAGALFDSGDWHMGSESTVRPLCPRIFILSKMRSDGPPSGLPHTFLRSPAPGRR